MFFISIDAWISMSFCWFPPMFFAFPIRHSNICLLLVFVSVHRFQLVLNNSHWSSWVFIIFFENLFIDVHVFLLAHVHFHWFIIDGLPLEWLLTVLGMALECLGRTLECIWNGFGMYSEWLWKALECLWDAVGIGPAEPSCPAQPSQAKLPSPAHPDLCERVRRIDCGRSTQPASNALECIWSGFGMS